jgi:hypothetical protein
MAETKYVPEPDDASGPARGSEAVPDMITPHDTGTPEEAVRQATNGLQTAGGVAAPSQEGYNAEEEEEIRRRLEDLGYI